MGVYANSAQSYYGAFRGVPTLDPGLAFRIVNQSVGISRSMRGLEARTVPDPDRPNLKNDQLPSKGVGAGDCSNIVESLYGHINFPTDACFEGLYGSR